MIVVAFFSIRMVAMASSPMLMSQNINDKSQILKMIVWGQFHLYCVNTFKLKEIKQRLVFAFNFANV